MESKVICMNILDYFGFPETDIVWTDPPWEQRMVNWFVGKMLKDTGDQVPPFKIEDIINHLGLLADRSKPVFIEYSRKGSDLVIDIMKSRGHKHKQTIEAIQFNGDPFVIMSFNFDHTIADGKKEYYQMNEVKRLTGFKSVFDPFGGIGKTAAAVHRNDAAYIGSELNPARFERLKQIIDQRNEVLQKNKRL